MDHRTLPQDISEVNGGAKEQHGSGVIDSLRASVQPIRWWSAFDFDWGHERARVHVTNATLKLNAECRLAAEI